MGNYYTHGGSYSRRGDKGGELLPRSEVYPDRTEYCQDSDVMTVGGIRA